MASKTGVLLKIAYSLEDAFELWLPDAVGATVEAGVPCPSGLRQVAPVMRCGWKRQEEDFVVEFDDE